MWSLRIQNSAPPARRHGSSLEKVQQQRTDLLRRRIPARASELTVSALGTPHLPNFAKFCQRRYNSGMSTMNISLPDSLKDFVDEQVNEGGYGTSSEYVRELIRKDKDRLRLRGLLFAGAASAPTKSVDEAYFDRLRRKVKSGKAGTRR
jgi:antitoxin ParD1/3/4